MIIELKLPNSGMGIAEGEVQKWLKAEGEPIAVGEVLVEIETAKALEELESSVNGVLKEIVAPKGATVEIGAVLALLEETL